MKGLALAAVAGAMLLSACATEPASWGADKVLLGRVTAVFKSGLFHPEDPDQEFAGNIYTFRTIEPNGDPPVTVQFVGPTICPLPKAGDQVYLVFLTRKMKWLAADNLNAPFKGDWSKLLYLEQCVPVDEKSSMGFTRYIGSSSL